MCALTKMPEYRKKYTKKEMAATIGVCEDIENSLAQCRYVSRLLPLLLLVSYILF